MASNKSIDGLTTRDAKKSTKSATISRVVKKPRSPESVTGIVKPTKTKVRKITAEAPLEKTPEKTITKLEIEEEPISESQRTLGLIESIKRPIESDETDIAKPDEPVDDIVDDNELELDILTESDLETPSSNTSAIEDFLSPVQAFDLTEGGELSASKTEVKDMKKDAKSEKTNAKDKKHKQKKQKKPIGKVRKTIAIIALVLVIIAIGVVIWGIFWGNDIIAKITGGRGNLFDLISMNSETYEPLKTDSNGRTNILAFGTSGYNMEGDEGDGTHDGAQLTDSIMLISLNQDTGDVAMLSLPRDLKASPTCTATGKINEVYWCNNMKGDTEEAGAVALAAEVGSILGVDIQYYAHLNWGSLISIVDTLGGIKITLDEDIEDYYYTGAVYEAGVEYEIGGEEALGLARARHGTSGGDFSRGASQQKILIGIKDKIFEKNLSLTDIISLASTLGDDLRTNFSVNELKTLAHLTFTFDFDAMRQISLYDPTNDIRLMTTGMINGISYVLPSAGVGNYSAIQSYVSEQLSNDPRVYEAPSIGIFNASDVVGLASDARALLISDGYTNVAANNAPEGSYPAGTTLYTTTDAKPGTKALLENYYKTTAGSADSIPSSIPHDYDFIIIINP